MHMPWRVDRGLRQFRRSIQAIFNCMAQLVGLLADTHGVFDPVAAALLKGSHTLLHAGDVGHHGGHKEVLKAYAEATAAPVLAVSGNVDDVPGTAQLLPPHRMLDVAGWKLLLVHIVAPSSQSKVNPATAALVAELRPDLVVFGHSHKAAHWMAGGVHYINPGSAGPARFKLKRSVAKLWLPHKPSPEAQLKLHVQEPCAARDDVKAAAAAAAAALAASPAAADDPAQPFDSQQQSTKAVLQLLQLTQKAPPRLRSQS